MKKLSLVGYLSVLAIVAGVVGVNEASAFIRGPGNCSGRLCSPIEDPFCAPEVQEGNLAAADRILDDLSNSADFRSAAKLHELVHRTKTMKSEEKVSVYFGIIGVDPEKNDEIAEFIGSREVQPRHIKAVEKNLDLSEAQSRVLVERLSSGLKGGLR